MLISAANSVVISLHTYLEVPLEDAVSHRTVQSTVEETIDIGKLPLKEILIHKLTRKDLSVYLMNSLNTHLMYCGLQFILAGNGKLSFRGRLMNRRTIMKNRFFDHIL